MKEKLELLQKMLNPGFDWRQNDTGIESLFGDCFKYHDYRKQGERPIETFDCGSVAFRDTPKTLYRLLYLVKTASNIDFSDMYKSTTLVELCSPDYHFCASFQFYKYEIAAYFHCSAKWHSGKCSSIICGLPGIDNYSRCISETGNLWFETLEKCLNYEYRVYMGNDFTV